MPLRALRLYPDSLLHCCCCSRLRLHQLPVPVFHLGLQTSIVSEKPSDPGLELLHLPGLGERPDHWDDPVRSHPQLRADLLQRLLHRFVLHPGLLDAPCYVDEGFLHPFLSLLHSHSFRSRFQSRDGLLRSWARFRWNWARRPPRPNRGRPV